MRELHRELDQRYRALAEARRGPVFFVEHGLSDGEIDGLFSDVRQQLGTHPLESGWWSLNCLPLLVASTEIGYRYRGTGTDFWPVLETEFGANVSATDRQRIRDLFHRASKIYRGAQPPTTPWARAFRLIAWPITHALVPLEFHRPLALALANLRVKVDDLSDVDLHRAVRVAASSTSARFSTLLEDSALIVAVTRMLLGDSKDELCPETMRRIAEDLAADQVSRRAVVVARRAQRTAFPKPPMVRLPSIVGSLHLRWRDSAMTLEAVFPPMEEDVQSRLRRALRRRRYAARLWGVSTPVPSVQLLSCLPFTVKLTAVPPREADLLPDLDQVDIEPEMRSFLAAFELRITPPLLFAVSSDGTHGRQIHGPIISGDRRYWLLSGSGEGPHGCSALGEVGPYDCHLLNPAQGTARQVLSNLGFKLRFGVSIEFAGSPPLDRDTPVPEFAVEDQRIVMPRRPLPEGLSVQMVGDAQIRLAKDDVATIVVERGDHTLRVSNGDESRDYMFRGVPSPRFMPPVICSVEPRSTDLSVQGLLRGTLDFAVESSASLAGLELTVEIEASGRKFFATAQLGPLPCTVSSAQEPFKTLLSDETRELLAQASSPTLRLSVGHLCSLSVVLEQRVRPCWWQREGKNSVTLTSEIGALPFGRIPATAPAARPTPASDNLLEEARLLVPTELDVAEYGDAAQFTTFCVAPSRIPLEAPSIEKPDLARRRRAEHDALGLEDLIECYLRWSLAESSTIIAEIRRQQVAKELDGWIAEICCGQKWVRCEAEIGDMDPWEELFRICDETDFGRDSYVELTRENEIEVTRMAVQEIRLEMPDLWMRVGPPYDLMPEDYETLDLACGRAYTKLAGVYRGQGKAELADVIEEGDPGAASDEWDSILGRVKSTAELQPLAEMLLPSDMAHRLMTLDPSMMTLDELTEELTWWARDARRALAGSMPAPETLKAILALWIEPEAAVGLDWRGALDVLLAERAVARAERYLALRSLRTARQGSAQ